VTDFRPLHGLRVLELAGFVSGPFCGKLLADLGADVAKIEPPDGDPARAYGPFKDDVPDPAHSGIFMYLNHAKRLAGRDELASLLGACDVAIVDRTGDVPDRAAHPDIVVTAVTPFGLSGPRAHWRGGDLIVAAASGFMSLTGSPDREPLRPGGLVLLHQAGLHAAIATLLQLGTGRGGLVDISEQEAGAWPQVVAPEFAFDGKVARRQGPRLQGAHGVGLQRTVDGQWLMTGFLPERSMWESLAKFLGNPEWMSDPRFQSTVSRSEHADEVERLAAPEFARFARAEAVEALQAARVPVAPVQTLLEIAASPQLAARGFWIDAAGVRMPGAPVIVTRPRGAGSPGSDGAPTPRDRPLAGVTVLDFSRVWAGPVVTRVLAENGARVIKIESRTRPDTSRFLRPIRGGTPDGSGWFQSWNFGKRDITLDFKHPDGVALARALAARADVVVENFSPGVMDRLGLGWSDLSAHRDDLVMLSLSGLGQTGPHRHWVMFGELVDALSGMMQITGYPDGGPTIASAACGDPVSGLMGALHVLAALRERERTGRGAYIDLSMHQTMVGLLSEPAMEWTLNGRAMGRRGNADPRVAVHGVFPCVGGDRWIAIAADAAEARRLQELAGGADLAAWTRTQDDGELAGRLQTLGVAASRVATIADLFTDPQLRARGFVRSVDHPVTGPHDFFALPCRIATSEMRPAPLLGQHTRDVLRHELGLADAEIDRLERLGALS
jgi:crotonobetainyl-CoA:carnitine CoA-transferase CaiB-like acyl-CoA transferase